MSDHGGICCNEKADSNWGLRTAMNRGGFHFLAVIAVEIMQPALLARRFQPLLKSTQTMALKASPVVFQRNLS